MATRKLVKKEERIEKEEVEKIGHYFYGLGKRKTAIAQVRVYLMAKEKKGIMVNKKELDDYFPIIRLRELVKSPLLSAGQDTAFKIEAIVKGGGFNAQAEAIRLGIARALVRPIG